MPPASTSLNPAFLRVSIGGRNTHQMSEDAVLQSVEIHDELCRHSTAKIEYWQSPDRRIPIEEWVGQQLEITAVSSDGTELCLFAGPVREVFLDFEISGSFRATVLGVSMSWLMDIAPRYKTYDRAETTSHLQTLCNNSGLDLERNLPSGSRETVIIQYKESDFNLFSTLVDSAGSAFRVVPLGLDIFDTFTSSGVTLKWRTEGSLLAFRLRGAISPFAFNGSHYDIPNNQSAVYENLEDAVGYFHQPDLVGRALGRSRDLNLVGYYPGSCLYTSPERIQASIAREAGRSVSNQVYGEGQSLDAALAVGKSFDLDGLEGLNGTWGVTRISHFWTPSGYSNSFRATTSTWPLPAVRPATPFIAGPMRARVIDNNLPDPGYVKVRFFWDEAGAEVTVPLSSTHCGAGRGIYFKPEIGDDVIIAFYENSPARPFLLSAAWNGVELPPSDELHGGETSGNDIKRIVTKSGNRIVMDDLDGNETMVLATPNHVRVSLFDGGQKLLLQSDGDINIHAGGTIHMKCAHFLREVG